MSLCSLIRFDFRFGRLSASRRQAVLPARVFRAGEAVFWVLLVLAVSVGAGQAGDGLATLGAAFSPGGLMAAEARGADAASGTDAAGVVRMKVTAPSHGVFSHVARYTALLHEVPFWLSGEETATSGGTAGLDAPAPRVAQNAAPAASGARGTGAALPAIAIIIDDLGADQKGTRRAAALPAEIALSFLPYPPGTPQMAREAAAAGHDVMVHLPMQAEAGAYPGPNALMVNLPAAENIRRMNWALSQVPGYVGINNHMGSRFTETPAALTPVMQALSQQSPAGTFFFDSVTSPRSQAARIARSFGLVSAERDIFLDDKQTEAEVTAELAQLERVARVRGVAVAIGHPHAVTLAVLERWCANLKGVRLVRIREAIRLKNGGQAVPVAASEDMTGRDRD